MDLSIVTTMYYSAPYLEEFCARVRDVVEPVTREYEIVLVNDGSPDNALEVARALHAQNQRIRIVDLSRNFGHHKAMMTGLAYAQGDLIFLIDCDLEEPPEAFTLFYETLQGSKADVVFGVQKERKGPLFSRLTGWAFYRILNVLASSSIVSDQLTARLMTRRYVQQLLRHQEHLFYIEGLWNITGFEQIPVKVNKARYKGSSTYTLSRKIASVVYGITAFSSKPLYYIAILGTTITLFSGLYIAYLLYAYIFLGYRVDGYTSIMVSIWFSGGLIILLLGVIAVYLSVIFVETKNRPYTIVREVYEHAAGTQTPVPAQIRAESEQPMSQANHDSPPLGKDDLKSVRIYFEDKVKTHGPTYRGVDFSTPDRQSQTFDQLMKICLAPDRPFSINDYGCGYGALVPYLVERGRTFQYTGYDFSAEMIGKARELHGHLGTCTFTSDEQTLQPADYTVAGSIFNVKLELDNAQWTQYLLHTLDSMWALSNKGMSFNILTKYSDPEKMRPDLYYADPCFLFDYCKTHYAKDVALLHDYGRYEFTMLVRRPPGA